jgi:hypothetical protein
MKEYDGIEQTYITSHGFSKYCAGLGGAFFLVAVFLLSIATCVADSLLVTAKKTP